MKKKEQNENSLYKERKKWWNFSEKLLIVVIKSTAQVVGYKTTWSMRMLHHNNHHQHHHHYRRCSHPSSLCSISSHLVPIVTLFNSILVATITTGSKCLSSHKTFYSRQYINFFIINFIPFFKNISSSIIRISVENVFIIEKVNYKLRQNYFR